MAFIYKITNKINSKCYVGKTNYNDPEKRFKQHLRESKQLRNSKRPLSRAIRKYGKENFVFEILEEISDRISCEREIYWIAHCKSYKYGYNATIGGDGKSYINYDEIIEEYKQCQNMTYVSEKLGVSTCTVSKTVRENGLGKSNSDHFRHDHRMTPVCMFLKNGTFVREFKSTRDASAYLIDKLSLKRENERGYASHISSVCSGKRKSCGGYHWKYKEFCDIEKLVISVSS